MSTDTSRSQESTGTVTGPHRGYDEDGAFDHRFWRCERCGLESTDSRLREGCFRCGCEARAVPEEDRPNRGEPSSETTNGAASETQETCATRDSDGSEGRTETGEEDDARRA